MGQYAQGRVYKFGQMVRDTMATGRTIKLTERGV